MHYIGVLSIVHFNSQAAGAQGLSGKETLPKFIKVWREGLAYGTAICSALLIVLFSGYSPNMAAFIGLMFCIVVGFASFAEAADPGHSRRL